MQIHYTQNSKTESSKSESNGYWFDELIAKATQEDVNKPHLSQCL